MSNAEYCALENHYDEVQATNIGSQCHDDDPSNQLAIPNETSRYAAEHTEANSACAETNKTTDENDASNSHETATWRPTWLQPSILASFSGLFLVFSILLLLMSLEAKRNDGLFETWQGFRLAWRFGPTTVLTLVCALWARVELQALRYMPWIAARGGRPFDPDLDYVSMITPTILVQSLRRRHMLVFVVSAIALILKVELLLAAGLFSITPVTAKVPVDVEVLDNFNPTYEMQNYTTETLTSAFFAARAIHDFDMVYPFGVDERIANQTFVSSRTKTRGTIQTPLKAVVDGFFSSIDCVLLQSFSIDSLKVPLRPILDPRQDGRVGPARWGVFETDLKIQFEGCNETVTVHHSFTTFSNTARAWNINHTRETSLHSCPDFLSRGNQFLYSMSEWSQPNEDVFSRPKLENVAAVLCTPAAWLSKVEVVDDGYDPNITLLPKNATVPLEANIWELFTDSVPQGYENWSMPGTDPWFDYHYEYLYGPLVLDVHWFNNQSTTNITSKRLRDATVEGSRRFGPLLGHYILRQGSTGVTPGTSLAVTNRLSVSNKTGLSMSVLFLAIAISTGYASSRHKDRLKLWTRDPATTFGFLVYLTSRPGLMCTSTGPDYQSEKKLWEESTFSPLFLRPWVQGIFTTYVCGLITCISVTLHLSQSQYGLVTDSEHEDWQLLWTSVPSLVALSVVLYLSSCDAAWRSVSTLSCLSVAPQSCEEIDVSTADMFGVWALRTLFRQRNHVASAIQILVLFCGLLTTLTAVVFSVSVTTESLDAQLQQNSWFGDPPIERQAGSSTTAFDINRTKLSTLFALKGEMNYTYPKNTFADLVFPNITAESLPKEYLGDEKSGSKMELMAMIPALKLTSICKPLPEDAIPLSVAVSGTEFLANATIFGNCANGTQFTFTYPLNISSTPSYFHDASPHQLHFGAVLPSAKNRLVTRKACNASITRIEDLFEQTFTRNYIWGSLDTDRSTVGFKRLFECNYSWSEIQVEANLLWSNGELLIDKNNPPRQHEPTTKPWSPPLKVLYLDFDWISYYSPSIFSADFRETPAESGYLDPYFKHITSPYGRVAVDVFGDPSMDQEILKQLNYYLSFTSAQIANVENRLPLGQDLNTSAFPSDGLSPIDATATLQRNRLVQSPTITYIIISILGPVFIFHLIVLIAKAARHLGLRSKMQVSEKGLVPKGFSSPGMIAALFHGTNATKYIPANAHELPPNELYKMMEGVRFRMGWFMKESDQTLHYTIGVLDDEEFTFMGSKAEMAAMDRHRARAD